MWHSDIAHTCKARTWLRFFRGFQNRSVPYAIFNHRTSDALASIFMTWLRWTNWLLWFIYILLNCCSAVIWIFQAHCSAVKSRRNEQLATIKLMLRHILLQIVNVLRIHHYRLSHLKRSIWRGAIFWFFHLFTGFLIKNGIVVYLLYFKTGILSIFDAVILLRF